ncbi:hypothetical protein EYF80_008470 [Liparis tanakae]|uniref:Uncharacterized protein n=1 Tax=Liparis tanakae TaxID=230148 RepID=A0A4Z2IV69_9TELE|nr:hypothetical protein EYF80_008470 [Liparis tanakae]
MWTACKAKPECCAKEDAELRTRDIDYDSFVGLMGRRSVAQPKRHIDHTFADMLGRLTGFNAFRNGTPRLLHLRAAVTHSSLDQRTITPTFSMHCPIARSSTEVV